MSGLARFLIGFSNWLHQSIVDKWVFINILLVVDGSCFIHIPILVNEAPEYTGPKGMLLLDKSLQCEIKWTPEPEELRNQCLSAVI